MRPLKESSKLRMKRSIDIFLSDEEDTTDLFFMYLTAEDKKGRHPAIAHTAISISTIELANQLVTEMRMSKALRDIVERAGKC